MPLFYVLQNHHLNKSFVFYGEVLIIANVALTSQIHVRHVTVADCKKLNEISRLVETLKEAHTNTH